MNQDIFTINGRSSFDFGVAIRMASAALLLVPAATVFLFMWRENARIPTSNQFVLFFFGLMFVVLALCAVLFVAWNECRTVHFKREGTLLVVETSVLGVHWRTINVPLNRVKRFEIFERQFRRRKSATVLCEVADESVDISGRLDVESAAKVSEMLALWMQRTGDGLTVVPAGTSTSLVETK